MTKPNKKQAPEGTGTSDVATSMLAIHSATSQAWLSFMSESGRFLTERVQQNLDAQKAMMVCKSPTELLQLQAAFLKATMDQYTDHANRIQEMTKVTTVAIKDAQSGHARSYDDVPI